MKARWHVEFYGACDRVYRQQGSFYTPLPTSLSHSLSRARSLAAGWNHKRSRADISRLAQKRSGSSQASGDLAGHRAVQNGSLSLTKRHSDSRVWISITYMKYNCKTMSLLSFFFMPTHTEPHTHRVWQQINTTQHLLLARSIKASHNGMKSRMKSQKALCVCVFRYMNESSKRHTFIWITGPLTIATSTIDLPSFHTDGWMHANVSTAIVNQNLGDA